MDSGRFRWFHRANSNRQHQFLKSDPLHGFLRIYFFLFGLGFNLVTLCPSFSSNPGRGGGRGFLFSGEVGITETGDELGVLGMMFRKQKGQGESVWKNAKKYSKKK
jgi:hypothetical protein